MDIDASEISDEKGRRSYSEQKAAGFAWDYYFVDMGLRAEADLDRWHEERLQYFSDGCDHPPSRAISDDGFLEAAKRARDIILQPTARQAVVELAIALMRHYETQTSDMDEEKIKAAIAHLLPL